MLILLVYLSLNKRFTKSILDLATIPSILILRFRFFDFFVRMWRLNAFWCVILPVPVTLNRFLALEFSEDLRLLETTTFRSRRSSRL